MGRSTKRKSLAQWEVWHRKNMADHPDWNWVNFDPVKAAKSNFDSQQRSIKRRRALKANWPAGKQKSQVILEHIGRHKGGLTAAELRQWVYEKNGHKGKVHGSYYMGMLMYDEGSDGKLRLLPGWCVQDPVTKRWRLKKGVKIEPPFFRWPEGSTITAEKFREKVGREPYEFGILMHPNNRDCVHALPDEHLIHYYELSKELQERLGVRDPSAQKRDPLDDEKWQNKQAYERLSRGDE